MYGLGKVVQSNILCWVAKLIECHS